MVLDAADLVFVTASMLWDEESESCCFPNFWIFEDFILPIPLLFLFFLLFFETPCFY